MSKKIAIVCNYALNPNRIGGMDRFYVAFDSHLKLLDYEVHWYFTSYQPFYFFENLTIFSSEKSDIEHFFIDETQSYNRHYDILITHFVALCTIFFKKAKKLGIGYTIAVDHNPRPLEGFSFSKRIKNKIKGIWYSNYIDQFIGVSEYTKMCILKDYGNFLNKKTTVIYNGIDTVVFKKRIVENKNRFVVSSHLRYSKGIQDLIMALNAMDIEVRDKIKIDVYGEGPYEAKLKAMVITYELSQTINFMGSSSNLNILLSEYSFMIQPTYMECFSLSILESLAANVPVITTTVGGNPEIIIDGANGFLFAPKDVQTLTKLLTKIVKGELAIENGVNALIEKDFTLNLMIDNHIKMLPEL